MESKYVQIAYKFYFMVVAVLMYYFLNEVINLGLFITYRHVLALLLFASAFFQQNRAVVPVIFEQALV